MNFRVLFSFARIKRKVNFRNVAYILILFLAILLGMLFGEVNNAGGAFGSPFNTTSTVLFYLGILLTYAIAFYIAIRNKILRINNKFFIFLIFGIVILLYMSLVSLCTKFNNFPSGLNITPLDRAKSIMDVSLSLLMAFSFFFLLPAFKEKDLAIKIFAILFIGFTIVMIIYSLSTEIDKYIEFINHPSFFTKYEQGVAQNWCYSFFTYGNVYGHVLFLCCLVVTLLSVVYKRRFIFLFNFILAVFILFSGSRTALLGFTVLCIVYGIYFLLHLYKRNKIYFLILGMVFLFTLLLLIFEIFLFKTIKIHEDVLVGENEYQTVTYTLEVLLYKFFYYVEKRLDLYEMCIAYYNTTDYIFGIGYNLNDLVCRITSEAFNFHNGYVEVFSAGGILLSLVYLFLIGYMVYKAIKIHKYFPKFTMFFFVSLLSYLVYQLGEAFIPLFNVFGGGIMGYYLFGVILSKERETNESIDIKSLFYNKKAKEVVKNG